MKFMYKYIAILTILSISVSCVKEEMVEVNPNFILSFQREGNVNALAGKSFYIIPTGSGEYLTLFDGSDGHVWGESEADGEDFQGADSLMVTYSAAGKYQMTLVSTSTGDYGKTITRKTKTQEITVVDERNKITLLSINGAEGQISASNEISFSVPDIVTDFHFPATFVLDSPLSKVYVNGVEQVSGTTVNDFSEPVTYVVKSDQGNENQYVVKFTTFPASSEKQITKLNFGVGGNGEIGVINEADKTITFTANYATALKSVRLLINSSYASKLYLDNKLYSDRTGYNLSPTGIKSIKVVAQDGTEAIYTFVISQSPPVSSFTFNGLIPEPIGIIDAAAKTIKIDVLNGTDITKLAAKWTGSLGKVTVGSTQQTNGVSLNNFTSPVTFTFYQGSTAGDKYVVTVNVK